MWCNSRAAASASVGKDIYHATGTRALCLGWKMAELPRPWCCPEPTRCVVLHQLVGADDPDLSNPTPGESWVCFGRMVEAIQFVYDGAEHNNDLRSCHYTPLKGVVANQENADDWRALGNSYSRAARKVSPP